VQANVWLLGIERSRARYFVRWLCRHEPSLPAGSHEPDSTSRKDG
jgi:hypothetical protein